MPGNEASWQAIPEHSVSFRDAGIEGQFPGQSRESRDGWQVWKQVVIYHHRQGLKPGNISRKLLQEGIKATGRGIAKFLAKFIESASVARRPWSRRPSKRNGPCNGTDRGTERNGPFYAVFRKTLSPCNANGTDRL